MQKELVDDGALNTLLGGGAMVDMNAWWNDALDTSLGCDVV